MKKKIYKSKTENLITATTENVYYLQTYYLKNIIYIKTWKHYHSLKSKPNFVFAVKKDLENSKFLIIIHQVCKIKYTRNHINKW